MTQGGASRVWGGTTLDVRRTARRRRLIEVGFELLGGQGSAAVSVRSVCRHARLTDRYFYESFADREELLIAVYDRVAGEFRDVLTRAVTRVAASAPPGPDRPAVIAREAVSAFLGLLTADPRKGRVLLLAPMTDAALSAHAVGLMPMFADLIRVQLAAAVEPMVAPAMTAERSIQAEPTVTPAVTAERAVEVEPAVPGGRRTRREPGLENEPDSSDIAGAPADDRTSGYRITAGIEGGPLADRSSRGQASGPASRGVPAMAPEPLDERMTATVLIGALSNLFVRWLDGTLAASEKQLTDYCVRLLLTAVPLARPVAG